MSRTLTDNHLIIFAIIAIVGALALLFPYLSSWIEPEQEVREIKTVDSPSNPATRANQVDAEPVDEDPLLTIEQLLD